MSLEEYKQKRDFEKTPEPTGEIKREIKIVDKENIKEELALFKETEEVKGDIKGEIKGPIFVIHEHHATRLHWDLRLEIGGVLRSWAVPKDPIDVNQGTKRLAIHVEDHPIDYASFEGTIPEGMYGAGTVKIWDNGGLHVEEETENKLTFELKGKKMSGRYALLKVPRMGEKSWLFIKKK